GRRLRPGHGPAAPRYPGSRPGLPGRGPGLLNNAAGSARSLARRRRPGGGGNGRQGDSITTVTRRLRPEPPAANGWPAPCPTMISAVAGTSRDSKKAATAEARLYDSV